MVRKNLFCLGLLCAFAMLLGAGTAYAQQMVSAKVLHSEGQVEIRRIPANQMVAMKIAFAIEERLQAGDTIITGRNGRLVLSLSDGSQAVIAAKTTVVIQDLGQSPRTLFNIIKGKTRVHIEKLGGQPNPYRVNTPTAVIAVRGTIFDVLVDDEETEVFLHEGEVAVTNFRLPNQPVILSAGQTTRVLLQRLPNVPGTFKPGRNDGTFRVERNGIRPTDSGRVADNGSRPNNGRGNERSNENGQPGQMGRQEPNRGGSPKPDAGRGGSNPNGGGGGPAPRSPSKRP